MDKYQFVDVLREKIQMLENWLLENTDISKKGYSVNSNASINKNEIVTVYLTCYKYQQDDDPIDLIIGINFEKYKVTLDADINWSGGSFIKDLGKAEISFSDTKDTISALDNYFEKFIKENLQIYADFVLNQ